MLTADGECRAGRPAVRDSQVEKTGIRAFPRQWNVLPLKPRSAHIDGGCEGRGAGPAPQHAGAGLDDQLRLAVFLQQNIGNTAHAVATRPRFGSVIVENADISVADPFTGRINCHQLVIRNGAGHSTRFVGGNSMRVLAHIDNQDLVAEPIHFYKSVAFEPAHASILPVYVRL